MVKLKNIKKSDLIIECDIIPEDSTDSGHIIVDLNSGDIKGFSLPDGYEWCRNHVNHARNNLITLANEDHMPKEYLVMWY